MRSCGSSLMDSINGGMRYSYDQSTLFDVKLALEAVIRQCQDIDNTFTNYSMKSSVVNSNFHHDAVDASMVVGVVSDDASSIAVRESPVGIVAYNLEPSTDSIDLVSNVGHMLEHVLHQPRDNVTVGSSVFVNVTPIVEHHASFVRHDGKQAMVPVSENCVDGDLCTDIVCIDQGQFDVGLKAGHTTILDKGGTVPDVLCDNIVRGVMNERCDKKNAVLNLILGAVDASGLDPSLSDDNAEEVTESARVCANRIAHCEYNAVDFDCSSGPAPTAGMVL